MSSERHARRKRLFAAALDLDAAEREPFVRSECRDDETLAQEVLEMLVVETSAPDFLAPTKLALGLVAEADSAEQLGRLGPFRVLRLIGEGGMGAVYEAEQDKPRRRVALKVLHPGFSTPQQLRRFELESEVLGRLEHPGIARIHQAGSSDTGRGPQPWFAMELVDGQPLTDWCSAARLPLAARLLLLAQVADAVHHAHQRGIVHRDLKPANVLVDANGQPKVLDFGIARATDADRRHHTFETNAGMIVGTLQYMSPEQAAANPDALDVRTDVYSLGVMLYELVGGRPPLELTRLPLHEAVRRVIEQEPPRLQSVARVPTDVAVIAHKALAKDKDRRYASAAELAADLRRFLRREPIGAQPPSRWYRLHRFATRNKAVVAAASLAFVALGAGLSVAIAQRNTAREAQARAEGINRFLLRDLLAAPSPERLGRDVRVVDVLAPATRNAERAFAGQPRVAAEVLDAVGRSYRTLGLTADAEQVARRAMELVGEDADDRLALRVRGHLVTLLTELDRAAEAVQMGRAVVAASLAEFGPGDPDTLSRRVELARALYDDGQQQAGVAELRAVVADQARVLGEEHLDTLASKSMLAADLVAVGEVAEAQELLTETLSAQDRILGRTHPATLSSRSSLGWILTMASEWPAAEAVYRELLPDLEAAYGADHPYTAQARVPMVQCLLRQQRMEEAETQVRMACDDLARRLGAGHRWSTDAQRMRIEVHYRQGQHDTAVRLASELVEQQRREAPDSEHLGHALSTLGRSLQEAGQDAAAAAVFREAADVYRAAFGKPTDFLAQMLYNLGVTTRAAGDAAAAIAPLQEAMALDILFWGEGHRHVVADRFNLARTLLDADRPADALAQIRQAIDGANALELEPWRVFGYREVLGTALARTGEAAAAEREFVAVLEGLANLGRSEDRVAVRTREKLVELLLAQGRAADAARYRQGGR